MSAFIFIALLANAALSGVVAYVAMQKGRSATGFFFLSFFFSFLVGILVVLALPAIEVKRAETSLTGKLFDGPGGKLIQCPDCADLVSVDAKVCKNCDRDVTADIAEILAEEKAAKQQQNADQVRKVQAALATSAENRAKRRAFVRSPKGRFTIVIGSVVVLALIAGVVLLALRIGSSSTSAAGCTNLSSGSASNSVTVTGDFGGKSTASFTSPLSVTGTQRTIVTKGTGVVPQTGETVDAIISIFSGADGSELAAQSYQVVAGDTTRIAAIRAGIDCLPVGTRSVVVVPASDILTTETALQNYGLSAEDALVLIVDSVSVEPNPEATSWTENVPSVTWNGSTPTVTLAGHSAPDGIQIAVLNEGDGATVTASDTVSVSYMGIRWSDGTVFQENYSSDEPVSLTLTGVFTGFRVALVGQKVGSRILVSIPAEYAYGTGTASTDNSLVGQDLVFLVDIVSVSS